MALNSGIQNYQILTNDDEVCIPSLSSILLAVPPYHIVLEVKGSSINDIKSSKTGKWVKNFGQVDGYEFKKGHVMRDGGVKTYDIIYV